MKNGNWFCFLVLLALTSSFSDSRPVTVSVFGKQPAVAIDDHNGVHVVFGSDDAIYYTFSREGTSFAEAQTVGRQEKLALGASRGPQIAVTSDYIVIAAADHTGRIFVYRRKRNEEKWSVPTDLLGGEVTAKEGFVSIAAGKENEVFAVWLDLRTGKGNNIFGAWSKDGGLTWSENTQLYAAPEGRVCPCCRPSVAADKNGNVAVMFRNEKEGARDLYLTRSKDGGRTFSPAAKLGAGTWMLDQCPMDGGAVALSDGGEVGTIWRRENVVYHAVPGSSERKIGTGRSPSMVKGDAGDYIAWQQGENIVALTPAALSTHVVGAGSYPRLASGSDNTVFCVWESPAGILAKKLD